jgi:uncharacterized membrane protein YhaH (DUF805 family)
VKPAHLFRLWFGLSEPVSRRAYVTSGIALMALKYTIDASFYFAAVGKLLSPLYYLSPFLSMRLADGSGSHAWLLAVQALIALPFLWIGVSMSVRRSADAGLSPWAGTWFVVPLANYVLIAVLAFKPSKGIGWVAPKGHVYRSAPRDHSRFTLDEDVRAVLLGIASAVVLGLLMLVVLVGTTEKYGWALFFLTPFMMGATTAYIYNRNEPRSATRSVGLACLSVGLASVACLLFAIEGLLCVVMAAPIALMSAIFGAVIGRVIARQPRRSGGGVTLAMALPLAGGAIDYGRNTDEREVVTSIEIQAPAERVWSNVVGFAELDPPAQWLFKTGIAYPMRARLEGEGVGAIRRCEFSTGPFVEPITVWEPARRLAFDVVSQPPSMEEWSPFRRIQPPHLETGLRSRSGEFRLVSLPGGRTRLEGRTRYALAIHPTPYWGIWSDALIGAIHERVLAHVKKLSEAGRVSQS